MYFDRIEISMEVQRNRTVVINSSLIITYKKYNAFVKYKLIP